MRRAVEVRREGHWPEHRAVGTLTLPFADRHRRRILLNDDQGGSLLLDLPHATLLANGDALLLDNQDYIRIRAATEEVLDIQARDYEHGLRLAWHIGNRHVPVQVLPGGNLRIVRDHVLVRMLEGLGARLTERLASFEPEQGAYAPQHHHG